MAYSLRLQAGLTHVLDTMYSRGSSTMLGPDKAGQGKKRELDHGGHVEKLGRR